MKNDFGDLLRDKLRLYYENTNYIAQLPQFYWDENEWNDLLEFIKLHQFVEFKEGNTFMGAQHWKIKTYEKRNHS